MKIKKIKSVAARTPAVLVLATGLLTGCASSYIAPEQSSTTARLRITEVGGINTSIQKLNAACIVKSKNARLFGTHFEKIADFSSTGGSSDFRRLNMPDPPTTEKTKFTEVIIDASKPFFLGYDAFNMRSEALGYTTFNCVNAVGFHPLSGKDYEATIRYRGFESCSLELVEIQQVNGSTRRSPVPTAKPIRDQCAAPAVR